MRVANVPTKTLRKALQDRLQLHYDNEFGPDAVKVQRHLPSTGTMKRLKDQVRGDAHTLLIVTTPSITGTHPDLSGGSLFRTHTVELILVRPYQMDDAAEDDFDDVADDLQLYLAGSGMVGAGLPTDTGSRLGTEDAAIDYTRINETVSGCFCFSARYTFDVQNAVDDGLT